MKPRVDKKRGMRVRHIMLKNRLKVSLKTPMFTKINIFSFILAYIISLSLCSLLYIYATYNNINLESRSYLLIIIFIYIFIYIIIEKVLPNMWFTLKDYLFSLVMLMPVVVLRIFSPLPLVDDLKYIGAALLVPNGFISLVGYSVLLTSKIFDISLIDAYWLNVFISLYSLPLSIIALLRKYFKLRTSDLYIVTLLTIYIPNLITFMLLPRLFIDPYSINRIIFKEMMFHYLGRNINLDPNLLKNVAVLLALIPLLSGFDTIIKGAFSALLFMLAFMYHSLDALATISLAIYYISVLRNSRTNRSFKNIALIVSALTIVYVVLWISLGGPYIALIWTNRLNSIQLFIVNALVLVLLISFMFILGKIVYIAIRKSTLITLSIMILPFLIAYRYSLPIEPALHRQIDLKAMILYGYYLIIILPFALRERLAHKDNSDDNRLIELMLFPSAIILLIIIITHFGSSILINAGIAEADRWRYIQVLARFITTPAFGFSLSIPPIVLVVTRRKSNNKMYLICLLLVVVSIANAIFFTSYWGFYYRNTGAVSGYNANQINYVLSLLKNVNISITPWIHTFLSLESKNVRDILALKAGLPLYTPTTINYDKIPYFLRNTRSFVPSLIITDSEHDILSDMLKPMHVIKIKNKEVRLYVVSKTESDLPKLAIIGPPLIAPRLNPQYYRDMVALQNYFNKYKLLVLPSDSLAKSLNISIAGKVKLVEEKELSNTVINLSSIILDGYNFMYFIPIEKTPIMKVQCLSDNRVIEIDVARFHIYPSYASEKVGYLLSLESLAKIVGRCEGFRILNAERVIVTKDYRVVLYVRKNTPGSLIFLHSLDYIFNGETSYIDIRESPILSDKENFSIISLYNVAIKENTSTRQYYMIYSEGGKGGTLFHISHGKNGKITFGFKIKEWIGCAGPYTTYSWSSVFTSRNGNTVSLYVNGVRSCNVSVSGIINKIIVTYSRVGLSQPFQNTWFRGTLSYIALYNESLNVISYMLSRSGIVPTQNLLYFIEPSFDLAFNKTIVFHNVTYRRTPIEVPVELERFYSDTYIHVLLPKDKKIILRGNCILVKTITHSRGFIEYIISIREPVYRINIMGNEIIIDTNI